VIDTRGANNLSSILAQSQVKKAHLILKEDGSQGVGAGVFSYATELIDLTIEGKIGESVNLTTCTKLSVVSMQNIAKALMNWWEYDDSWAEAFSYKLSANQWEALEASGKAPDGGTWKDYVINKGWLT
jgi:hypothetical protein